MSSEEESVKAGAGYLDLLLDTISADHPIKDEVGLLGANGHLVMLGLVTNPVDLAPLPLIFGRKSVAGSCIGGMPATKEVGVRVCNIFATQST